MELEIQENARAEPPQPFHHSGSVLDKQGQPNLGNGKVLAYARVQLLGLVKR